MLMNCLKLVFVVKYTQELNRHGKYHTVIRLYDKNALADFMTDDYYDKTKSQYDFAKDNIATIGGMSSSTGMDGFSQNGKP